MTLTRPRLSPISKLLAIPPNELATVLATTSSVSVARFRLIEVTIHVPLKGGLNYLYLRDEILGRFFSTSFEIGRLGSGFGSFLSILPLALGTMTSGTFFVDDDVSVLTSQGSLVTVLRFVLDDTVPKYLARPPLFLCTIGGLRNSELFATNTISFVFFIYKHNKKISILFTARVVATTPGGISKGARSIREVVRRFGDDRVKSFGQFSRGVVDYTGSFPLRAVIHRMGVAMNCTYGCLLSLGQAISFKRSALPARLGLYGRKVVDNLIHNLQQ
ncbi:hypothetical protein ALC56_06191 [Trachymyrmex septentrionalis]|uniref:Uncharacterized protein n=1 Tax=Trachymyrmex septentrionalis TaxID=34720 RepID=A0A195FH52_9HYME|nr:hypothetical protein ALC56_06191 [Trachymyrmex septentrionalis]